MKSLIAGVVFQFLSKALIPVHISYRTQDSSQSQRHPDKAKKNSISKCLANF